MSKENKQSKNYISKVIKGVKDTMNKKSKKKRLIVIETDGSSYNILKNETSGHYEFIMILNSILAKFKVAKK